MASISIEEFQERVDSTHPLDIEVVEFSGATKRAVFKYRCCGAIKTLASAKGIFSSKTCPGCNPATNKHTPEYVQKTFLDKHGITMLGDYTHEKAPILLRFPCGCEYTKTIGAMKAGNGVRCLKCNHRVVNHVVPLEEANDRLRSAQYGKYVISGTYTGISRKTNITCLECGGIHYNVSPNQVIDWARSCDFCGGKPPKSAKEKFIKQFLADLGLVFISEYRLPNGTYVDFYIPSKNKAIEFDGEYHDISEPQQAKDADKDSELAALDIPLLRVHHSETNITLKILEFLK